MFRSITAIAATLLVALTASVGSANTSDAPFEAGFGVREITPVGDPPAEWAKYFTPQPTTGVWGEPFVDLNGDGCLDGTTNKNLEPVLDGEPPAGDMLEPHIDQPWNQLGDNITPGPFSVRGVHIYGDPQSAGKWDGLWTNAGFGSKCTLGAKDHTWARAVAMRKGDTTVAAVSLDVVGFFNVEIQRIRKELKNRYPDMDVDEVIVASTHTHEGVDTMGYWGQLFASIDGKFPAYQAFIRSQVIDAIHEAVTSLEPAEVKFANGVYGDGVHGVDPDAIRDSRPPIVTDPAVVTAQFVRPDESVIGTMINWSNHPEAQGSNNALISSDFVHTARTTLEAEFNAPAVYFSGSVGGLQTPLGVNVAGFGTQSGDWARTYEIGRRVANAAIDALEDSTPQQIDNLDWASRDIWLDMDNNVLRALNANGIFDLPGYVGGDSTGDETRDGIYVPRAGTQVLTEMTKVSFGPGLLLTVPGELFPELELGGYGRPGCPETGRPYEPVISAQFDEEFQFVLGLGQDELGYIVPGYDFFIKSAPEDTDDGRGVVPLGALEVDHCGEGHYEETVSGSSVMAPQVACTAMRLAGKDPSGEPACHPSNLTTLPYGVNL